MTGILVDNERCKAVSNLFFTLCAALVAGSAVRMWEAGRPDLAASAWRARRVPARIPGLEDARPDRPGGPDMSALLDWGDYGPAILALLISAVGWVGIELEKRRRRRRAAAGLPIYGPAVPPEGEEAAGAVRQTLVLSREVVEHFRAMGPGWQARIDEVLKFHVRDEEDRARRQAVEAPEEAKARVAEERSGYEAGEGEGGGGS